MVPILNPNYNYEKLLREIELLKRKTDKVNEDAVDLDANTVCEDFELVLMEHIMEQAGEDLVRVPFGRKKVNKFGTNVDDNDPVRLAS